MSKTLTHIQKQWSERVDLYIYVEALQEVFTGNIRYIQPFTAKQKLVSLPAKYEFNDTIGFKQIWVLGSFSWLYLTRIA